MLTLREIYASANEILLFDLCRIISYYIEPTICDNKFEYMTKTQVSGEIQHSEWSNINNYLYVLDKNSREISIFDYDQKYNLLRVVPSRFHESIRGRTRLRWRPICFKIQNNKIFILECNRIIWIFDLEGNFLRSCNRTFLKTFYFVADKANKLYLFKKDKIGIIDSDLNVISENEFYLSEFLCDHEYNQDNILINGEELLLICNTEISILDIQTLTQKRKLSIPFCDIFGNCDSSLFLTSYHPSEVRIYDTKGTL